ncbi:MAG TPA: hypothetical protein VK890_05970, partial [Bacteroidia bacterium]|nr:hypothetical protein [Bacteroidia bacterium]
ATSGGDWLTTSTWIGGQIPSNTDNAVINGHVTISANTGVANNITINSGKTLTNNSKLLVIGSLTNNGTFNGTGLTYYHSATPITSTTTGGDWDTPGTWVGGVVPNPGYDVVINGNVTSSIAADLDRCYNLTINSGNTFTVSSTAGNILVVDGTLTNNGTLSGAGTILLRASGITVMEGAGTYSFTGTYTIAGNSKYNDTLSSNVTISSSANFNTSYFGISMTLVSMGNVTSTSSSGVNRSSTIPCKWINGPNSFLSTPFLFTNTTDTLDASANGNTIKYTGGSYTIKSSINNTYYNLTCSSSGTISLPANLTVLNNLTISSGTLDVTTSNYGLTVDGNLSNSGTFTERGGTVTLGGSGGQTLGGSTATIFYNLTASGNGNETVTLAKNETISDNFTISGGTLDCQTFQLTGNGTGTFSMASGSILLLGTTASTTNVSFPTNFTTAHISLNSASTVEYLANTASQSISVTPSYGNLLIDAGSAITKTPSNTTLSIAGNLTINTNPTLSETTNIINLMGNAVINGTLSFSTGSLNIGGNFTDNGTYTVGTGTIVFNGTGTQTIGGSSHITFNNMTISGSGAGTVQPTYPLIISNTLSITSGILDVTSLNYNVNVNGLFSNTGGTFIAHNDTVIMGGSSPTLGGSSAITLNKLIINSSSSTTLGGNITATSDVIINTGKTLNGATYTLKTAGNFIDNGTFTPSTSTVYFDNSGHQCIEGSAGTFSFKNLTVAALSILGNTGIVNIGGTITILPGGRMDCTCP